MKTGSETKRFKESFFIFPGTYQRHIQPFGAKEILRDGADLTRSNFVEPFLEFTGRSDLAVAEVLFTDPHHLIGGAFEAEIDLANDIIASPTQFSGRGERLGQKA